MPLRILELAANRWWTGSADPVLRLVQGLRARGHQVLLGAVRGDRFEAKVREAGLTLLPDLSLDAHGGPRAFLLDFLRIRRLIGEAQIQIVHCHHSHDHWLGALARSEAALFRTFHNLRSVGRGWSTKILYRRTHGIFAVNREIESHSREAGFGPGQVWYLPGASDLERFAPNVDGGPVREELGLGAAPVVGCVARFAPKRDHELLLRGFRILLRDVPQARLLLVGKGELRPELERRVEEFGLRDRVLFTGYRDQDLPQVLAAMDCFAFMGAGSDASCRAALEAMASGKPVVARRVAALPELILDGETGLLLWDDRPESVAVALATILQDPARARRMGAAGRQRAETEFSPQRTAAVVEEAFRAVLRREGTPGEGIRQ